MTVCVLIMFSPGPDVHMIHGPRRHQTLLTDGAVFRKKTTTNFLEVAYIIDQKRGVIDIELEATGSAMLKNIYMGELSGLSRPSEREGCKK